jgi:hypothetical protein
VDKETQENFPRITRFLRLLVSRFSFVIFVTDPLLVPIARRYFPKVQQKIDYITFGLPPQGTRQNTDKELLSLLKDLSLKEGREYSVLFCPTGSGDKYLHISNAVKLLNCAKNNGIKYKIVIAGQLDSYLNKRPRLMQELLDHPDIFLFSNYINYDSIFVSNYIDAYWRSLKDQSVSFTLYEAALVKKPILTISDGFMGAAVEKYSMGAVLDLNFSNIKTAHQKLMHWNKDDADIFLESHSWDLAAKQISKHIIK